MSTVKGPLVNRSSRVECLDKATIDSTLLHGSEAGLAGAYTKSS